LCDWARPRQTSLREVEATTISGPFAQSLPVVGRTELPENEDSYFAGITCIMALALLAQMEEAWKVAIPIRSFSKPDSAVACRIGEADSRLSVRATNPFSCDC